MLKKLSTIPFNGTAEQDAKLDAVIAANKHDKSRIMAVMQEAQEIYGYLPIEVQNKIAEGMSVPLEKIYGVATFYAQFSLTPKGDNIIQVCTGTACYVKGAQKVLDRVYEELGIGSGETTPDGKFTIQDTRCLGCCGLAPVMTVNEDVYGRVNAAQVPGILDKYRAL